MGKLNFFEEKKKKVEEKFGGMKKKYYLFNRFKEQIVWVVTRVAKWGRL